jgi:hypothetical protein
VHVCARRMHRVCLTLIMLTWTIWRAPTSASKWRMGFNSAFKGLIRWRAGAYTGKPVKSRTFGSALYVSTFRITEDTFSKTKPCSIYTYLHTYIHTYIHSTNQSVIHSFIHSINSKNQFNETVIQSFSQAHLATPLIQSIQCIYYLFIYSFILMFREI